MPAFNVARLCLIVRLRYGNMLRTAAKGLGFWSAARELYVTFGKAVREARSGKGTWVKTKNFLYDRRKTRKILILIGRSQNNMHVDRMQATNPALIIRTFSLEVCDLIYTILIDPGRTSQETSHLHYRAQPVNAVWGNSRCLL
jgi:hypothetical protein